MGVPARPHVLIVVAARFLRIASKYRRLAHSLVLKNVGVLMQTMYLSATAMDLPAAQWGPETPSCSRRRPAYRSRRDCVGQFCLGEPALR
jgi:oxazoline/thiazoline dehydrogenase